MLAIRTKPHLAKSPRLSKDSSNLNSENINYDITPCNVHCNLYAQNLNL